MHEGVKNINKIQHPSNSTVFNTDGSIALYVLGATMPPMMLAVDPQ